MKKIARTLVISTSIFLLATCGIDYTITTKINPDGSCERIMIARLDSSDLRENPFFIPIDSSWEKTTKMEYDSAENNTIAVVTVRTKYSSVEEMNKEFLRSDSLTEVQHLTMNLQKKFRWFHTKYRYEESYAQQFPFHHFPLSGYFTEEEIKVFIFEDPLADSIFFIGKDSSERAYIEELLEKKADKFIYENTFEEFYTELIRTSRMSDHTFFGSIILSEEKDKLMNEFKPCFTHLKDNCNDTSAILLLMRLDKLYSTDAFTTLGTIDSQAFKAFDQKLNTDYFAPANEEYEHNVQLPGTLLNTNAQKIIKGNPQWSFDLLNFVYCDFTMWAESKRTNNWAYVVTLILIVISLAMGVMQIRSARALIKGTKL